MRAASAHAALGFGHVLLLGSLVSLASCQAGVQVRAQSDEGASARATTDGDNAPSTPTAATTSAPEPVASPAMVGGVADGVPACPLHCAIATPRHRTLAQDEEERLRGAFAATMGGLRSCVSSERSDGRHVRPPALTIRFAPSGDLLDVGVDGTGFGYSAESCFQGVVRGSTTNPDVRLEGPATVRCVERCEHRPRQKKK